jgi:hypothetical protein
MESKDEVETRTGRPRIQSIILFLIVVISVVLAGWTLVTVSNSSQIPSSDFVTLPGVPLSTRGEKVVFVSVLGVAQRGLAVGVSGYLMTVTGAPVTGAKVYMTYYLQNSYRTQVATTDQNGYFESYFPMNWTGSLSVTFTYLGDDEHQGLTQTLGVSGEGL